MANAQHRAILAILGCLIVAACGGSGGEDAAGTQANHVSEDPFGATGAPGADMTDNGATDGAAGLADGNAAAADRGAATGAGNEAGSGH